MNLIKRLQAGLQAKRDAAVQKVGDAVVQYVREQLETVMEDTIVTIERRLERKLESVLDNIELPDFDTSELEDKARNAVADAIDNLSLSIRVD